MAQRKFYVSRMFNADAVERKWLLLKIGAATEAINQPTVLFPVLSVLCRKLGAGLKVD